MTTEQIFAIKKQLIHNADTSGARLAEYTKDKRGAMGLLNDEARNSETFKTLNAQYQYDKEQLRLFNKLHYHNKELIKMTKEDIMQRRIEKLNNIQGREVN